MKRNLRQLSLIPCLLLVLLSSCTPIIVSKSKSSTPSNDSGGSSNSGSPAPCVAGKSVFRKLGNSVSGGSDQSFIVPAGCRSIVVKAWGAGGGAGSPGNLNDGGSGGFTQTTLSVTPGEVLTVKVGHGGSSADSAAVLCGSACPSGTNFLFPFDIYGGGGKGRPGTTGNGGGASSLLRSGQALVYSGAGGGGGFYSGHHGGAGGGDTAASGLPLVFDSTQGYKGGSGGSQASGGTHGGGASSGTLGLGGNGGSLVWSEGEPFGGGGGGGGGYYGGGGGAGSQSSPFHYASGGGGGGSGFAAGINTISMTGSGTNPTKRSDVDYLAGVGVGGSASNGPALNGDGGDGLIVISWWPDSHTTPQVTYSSTLIDFIPISGPRQTSGNPTHNIPGGSITNCTIAYDSGPIPRTVPTINSTTCEISGFEDAGHEVCGAPHGPSNGTYFWVTPYVDQQEGTSVRVLLYNSADDSGPC